MKQDLYEHKFDYIGFEGFPNESNLAELNEAIGVHEGMQSKLAGPPSLRRMLAKKHRNLEKDASRVKSVLAKVPDVLKGEAETTRRHTSPQTTAEEKKAL